MENMRKHKDIKLVTTEKRKLFSIRTKLSLSISNRNGKQNKKKQKYLGFLRTFSTRTK